MKPDYTLLLLLLVCAGGCLCPSFAQDRVPSAGKSQPAAKAQALPSKRAEKLNLVYKTTPEGPLHLDLYYPASKPAGKYPVVIYTHGGGWAVGSKKSATSGSKGQVVQGLTEKGFCVASVDYRLYQKGGHLAIRDCVIDSKDAIRYLSKNSDELSVDVSRVVTFGDSAGGQIAQMLLLASPESLPGDEALAKYGYKHDGAGLERE